MLAVKVFLPMQPMVQYLLIDKQLDSLKKMFNMDNMEILLIKYLVNNNIPMHINKLPIHMEVLLKVNNTLVSNI